MNNELKAFCEKQPKLKDFLENSIKLDAVGEKELARVLNLITTPNELDFSLLVDYARAFSDVIRIQKVVEEEGELLISDRTGVSYINPRNSLLLNRANTLERLRKQLNMTPKSRFSKAEANKKTLTDVLES